MICVNVFLITDTVSKQNGECDLQQNDFERIGRSIRGNSL